MRPKNPNELKIMKAGGEILTDVLYKVCQKAVPGVTLLELDRLAEELIKNQGAHPSFKMVKNYHFATCLCPNEVVVHGLPTEERVKEEDILGVDIGVYYQGLHTDMAWTVRITDNRKLASRVSFGKQITENRFLEIGQKALIKAIEQARVGNRIGHISQAIEETIEKEGGYKVVRQLIGHGVGEKLHEPPEIPGKLFKKIEETPEVLSGQTLAIEVIYAEGDSEIVYKNSDGWTIITKDGSRSGLFEATVAVETEPLILTPIDRLLKRENSSII